MESHAQSIRIRGAINMVISTLIGNHQIIPGGGQTLIQIEQGVSALSQMLFKVKDIADERIVDYIVYFLYLRRNSQYRFTVGDMFSHNMMLKFHRQFMEEGGRSGMNYYIDQWLDEGCLSRAKLVRMIEKPKPHKMAKFVYMESDELIKKRFLNTDMGYMLCQRSTTGWSPRSRFCQLCEYASKCTVSTDKRFPELVRLRKQDYDNGKEKRKCTD